MTPRQTRAVPPVLASTETTRTAGYGAGGPVTPDVSGVTRRPSDCWRGSDSAHIVGWWQWVLGDVLRLKIPRGLCGESLAADTGRPDPSENAPLCQHCLELNAGWRLEAVPGYWLADWPKRLLRHLFYAVVIVAAAALIALIATAISAQLEPHAVPTPRPSAPVEAGEDGPHDETGCPGGPLTDSRPWSTSPPPVERNAGHSTP